MFTQRDCMPQVLDRHIEGYVVKRLVIHSFDRIKNSKKVYRRRISRVGFTALKSAEEREFGKGMDSSYNCQ